MLNILEMIILLIILFIIILLYIGVKISLTYEKSGSEFKGCIKILILKKIKIYAKNFPSEKKEDEKNSNTDLKELLDLAKPCFDDFKIFLKSFVKCIKVEKIENHLIFGLDSYVDTAKYIGYIWSLAVIVNNAHKNSRFTAEPSFKGSRFDIKGDNEVEINLIKMIYPILRLISKKEVRKLIRGVFNGQ